MHICVAPNCRCCQSLHSFTEDGSKGSLWDRVSAWRGGGSGKGGAAARLGSEGGDEGERETIHVFTVASGHM